MSYLAVLIAGEIAPRLYFVFSSRRRHTRLQADWSSDVCSSDLGREERMELRAELQVQLVKPGQRLVDDSDISLHSHGHTGGVSTGNPAADDDDFRRLH